MPIYTYECSECNYHFEVEQKMTDDRLTQCPECEEDALVRIITSTSFILMGGGWASTGYSKESA